MATLKNVQKGNTIRFTEKGLYWLVWHKTNGKHLNPVIQLKSENGTYRTFSPKSKRWDSEVYYA